VKELFKSARFLLFDMAGLLLFFLLYSLTDSVTLGVIAGLALALGQIGWELLRRKPVDTLQWVSLATVLAAGAGTLHTGNPLYVMLKPSLLYLLVGWAMLKRGWMTRYLPTRAME
jgi:intracellular septation protein A